jgi:hypothetical protein
VPAWGRCAAHANIGDAKGGITDMREDMVCSPKDSLEIRRQVQALDTADQEPRTDRGCKAVRPRHRPANARRHAGNTLMKRHRRPGWST